MLLILSFEGNRLWAMSSNVLNYLVEHYNIAPTGTVEDDLKAIFE